MTSLTHASLALYRYMCQHIVGTKKTVKTKRLLNNARDLTSYNKSACLITSGSFGEGLEMKGSDLDIMPVLRFVNIYETNDNIIFDPQAATFLMDIDETKPGFSKLRLISEGSLFLNKICIRKGGDLYLSSHLFKSLFVTKTANVIHGPCLSDKNGLYDRAYCLHSRSWITPAREWIHRAQNEWPSDDIKSYIVDYGVLFVPIGVKGSHYEELEWRISFSVGEKLLIYTFSHTQLLCYALMKILLKDVLERDIRCKNLLCSYFLKTIMFWVSEELPLSVWKPANLIPCFLRCFERLIYCVEFSVCPHYFIPENNLFENRINGIERQTLLENLYILKSYGWHCLLMSEQLSPLDLLSIRPGIEFHESCQDHLKQILTSFTLQCNFCGNCYENAIQGIISTSSYTVKSYWVFAMSKSVSTFAQLLPLTGHNGNKETYKNYNDCLSHLLLSKHHDAVSGWLMLASFFYKMKQYRLSLKILSYSLSKCTPEKVFDFTLSNEQYQLLKNFQYLGLQRAVKANALIHSFFVEKSRLIPEELELEVINEPHLISPVAFAHFLRFLCYYHLGDIRQYRASLRDIYLTITENFFTGNTIVKASAYNYLGIACQLTGDSEAARRAFLIAVDLDKYNLSKAKQRLQRMDT